MPRTVHPPEWPDKIMFAAMLLVIAGVLGAIFATLRIAGLTIDKGIADTLEVMGPEPGLVLSLATAALALHAIRHQAAVWAWLAVATAILSMGMLGLVPVLAFVAAGFLVRSRVEGEETIHDERRLHASLWPDKALAASLLLFVGGAILLLQALVVFRNDILLPEEVRGWSDAVAAASLAAGAWSLYASFEVYRLRRPWTGHVAAALNVATFAFAALGPALGIATFILLRKAGGEREFEEAAAAG